ncbi:hypothetical protein [Phenylobacterium kunshanense]|uniref:hypothetical protein n=1 Tax=Phenylobacterium kunshanense TaxID=1445034 RepID=UPI00197B2F24|nr:hypothetical protein [Phenylobacterium kunshanense]
MSSGFKRLHKGRRFSTAQVRTRGRKEIRRGGIDMSKLVPRRDLANTTAVHAEPGSDIVLAISPTQHAFD